MNSDALAHLRDCLAEAEKDVERYAPTLRDPYMQARGRVEAFTAAIEIVEEHG